MTSCLCISPAPKATDNNRLLNNYLVSDENKF